MSIGDKSIYPFTEYISTKENGVVKIETTTTGQPGMSCREWLIGQALAGYCANPHERIWGLDSQLKAQRASEDADAVIARLDAEKAGQ